MVPLSKVLLLMILVTALSISAVRSMKAGVLPAPTPSAGVPELYAALTMPGPPVARMRSQIFISSLVPSMVGMVMQLTRSGDTLQLRSAP